MTKQCPSCGGDCGGTKATGCRYNSTGAMAAAWFGTPGVEEAIAAIHGKKDTKIYPGGGEVGRNYDEPLETNATVLAERDRAAEQTDETVKALRKTVRELRKQIINTTQNYNKLVDRILEGTKFVHIDDYLAAKERRNFWK